MVPMRASTRQMLLLQRGHALVRGFASATFFGLLLVGLVAGCGGGGDSSGSGTTAPSSHTAVFGSGGGTVNMGDGSEVTFSSGMLKDGTQVTVSTGSSPEVPLGAYEDPVSSGLRVEIPASSLSESPSPTAGIALTYTPSLSSSASVGSLTSQAALTSNAYNLLRITISRAGNSIVTYGAKAFDARGKVVMWVPNTYVELIKSIGNTGGTVIFDMRETYLGRCFDSNTFGTIFQVLNPDTFRTDNFVTSPAKVPLVLVHGIQLNIDRCIDAYRTTWTTFTRKYFEDSNFAELNNKFLLYTFSYDTTKDISENGRLLAEELKTIPGAPSVVVLAHSMGGLVARSALANNDANIRGMVTLDTPHHGTLRFRHRDVWRAISDVAVTGVIGLGITEVLLDSQGAKQLDWDNFDNKEPACTPTCNQFLLDLWAKDQAQNNFNKYVAFASKAQEPSGGRLGELLAISRDLIYLIASKLGIPLDNDGVVSEVSALFRSSDYSPQPLRFHKTLDLPDHLAILESPAIDDPDIRSALLGFLQPPAPPPTFTLAVDKQGSGTGTVTSTPAGVNCGNTCVVSFANGTTVTLTATHEPGSTFTGWNGGGCSSTGTCIVAMTEDQSVMATYTLSLNQGMVQGTVRDFAANSGISNATLTFGNSLGGVVGTAAAGPTGQYSLALPPGTYEAMVSASGYITTTLTVEVLANQTRTADVALLVQQTGSPSGAISGRSDDAITENAVGDARVELRSGVNNPNGLVVASTTTDSQGNYSFTNIAAGTYTATVSKTGYLPNRKTVGVVGGQTSSGQNVTLSPVLASGEVRIVLTWGLTPSDLDSHLTGPDPGSTSRFHVYYQDRGSLTLSPFANLDRDDITSFGPETTTITHRFAGLYRFSVRDFINASSTTSSVLSESGAQVKVFAAGSASPTTFNVPPNRAGTLWTVFEMDGTTGAITQVNSLTVAPGSTAVQ